MNIFLSQSVRPSCCPDLLFTFALWQGLTLFNKWMLSIRGFHFPVTLIMVLKAFTYRSLLLVHGRPLKISMSLKDTYGDCLLLFFNLCLVLQTHAVQGLQMVLQTNYPAWSAHGNGHNVRIHA